MSAYRHTEGKVIDAQKIAGFESDSKTAIKYVVLKDGHKEPRPLVHGFIPAVGDYLITEAPVLSNRPGGAPYAEKSETYIVPAGWFEQNFSFIPVAEPPVEEPPIGEVEAFAVAEAEDATRLAEPNAWVAPIVTSLDAIDEVIKEAETPVVETPAPVETPKEQ
jgi:hypothetical protein